MKKVFIVSILLIFSVLLFGKATPVKADGCNNNSDCKHLGEGWYCLPNTHEGFGECQPPDKGLGGSGGKGQAVNIKCNCTTEFGACGDKFGKTNIQWRQCTRKNTGTETCNWMQGLKYYQYKDCETGPTVTPGGPTLTPTLPPDDPNCKCNALKNCTTQCQFDKFSDVTTYSNTIKCGLADTGFQTAPTSDNKNSWCRAEKRTKGDAELDKSVTVKNYFYYVTAKLGFKIPPTVNPDFNGDNVVDTKDRDIIIKSLIP